MWYDRPAGDWTEALPLGNGRLGAMLFGGVDTDQLLLNEKTIWTACPEPEDRADAAERLDHMRSLLFQGRYWEAEEYCQEEFLAQGWTSCYQPLGCLRTEFTDRTEASDYRRSLDIERAVATVLYEQGGVRHRREAFVSSADDVLVVRLSAGRPGSLSLSLTLDHPADLRGEGVSSDTMKLAGQAGHGDEQKGVKFQAWMRLLHEGGSVETGTDRIHIAHADSVTVLLAAATDYNPDDPAQPRPHDLGAECRDRLDVASGMPYEQMLERHVAEHRRLFDRVSLNISLPRGADLPMDERVRQLREGAEDPELLLFYFHYCRYVLISSSRPGSPPSNLQGVWNPLLYPPWHSHYQYNVNSQENYWFAEALNLAECHEPYLDFTERLTEAGKRTARLFGCRGSVSAGAFTDVWFTSRCNGSTVWGMWVMAGAWNAHHLMEHYRFTQDEGFLRQRAYPVLRETSLFLLDWLAEDPETGKLVSGPSASPENRFLDESGNRCSLTMGCACDQEIIWDTFTSLLEAAQTLGIEDPLVRDVRDALDDLALPAIASDGRLMEWRHELEEAEPGHRHVSHLFGLMPGNRISVRKTPDLARAVKASVDGRLANDYDAQGWSLGWVAAILVRLGEGDRALDLIKGSYCRKLYPNLFVDAHDQVQVGDMMGVPADMAEMLVQSQDSEIHLLPALPAEWEAGSLRGFCARGAFTVDLNWAGGKLQTATVLSAKGGRCVLRYGEDVVTIDTEPNTECSVPLGTGMPSPDGTGEGD